MPSECTQTLTTGINSVHSPGNSNKVPDPMLPSNGVQTNELMVSDGNNANSTKAENGGPVQIAVQDGTSTEGQASTMVPDSYMDVFKFSKSSMEQMLLQGLEKQTAEPSGESTINIQLPQTLGIDLISGSELLCNLKTESDSTSTSPLTSPGLISPAEPSMYSPDGILQDVNTQLSLVERSEGLQLEDPMEPSSFWSVVGTDEGTCKKTSYQALKGSVDSDGTTGETSQVNDDLVKDKLDAAVDSSQQFVFTKFGSDVQSVLTFGDDTKCEDEADVQSVLTFGDDAKCEDEARDHITKRLSSSVTLPTTTSIGISSVASTSTVDVVTSKTVPFVTVLPESSTSPTTVTSRPTLKRIKEPSLSLSFPAKRFGYELKILVQPEDQHRARYMTEGSRGAVKDRSLQGHPKIKLCGYTESITLQVFIGNDTGKVKPHGFYQACKVCGKNSTPCTERDIDGTTVIEIQLDPKEDMSATIDCVGILKLRNADVEQRIGLARLKKKSTRARMVFRVCIAKPDGSCQTLQVSSTPILCTQPPGQPEIGRMSLHSSLPEGGEDLFIIGKNFTKNTHVIFKEAEDSSSVWSDEVDIDHEFFQPGHLICTVPPYKKKDLSSPVELQVIVRSGGRQSEPQQFTYRPAASKEEAAVVVLPQDVRNLGGDIKSEEPMETDEGTPHQNSIISEEARMWNYMFQKASQTGTIRSLLPGMLMQENKKEESRDSEELSNGQSSQTPPSKQARMDTQTSVESRQQRQSQEQHRQPMQVEIQTDQHQQQHKIPQLSSPSQNSPTTISQQMSLPTTSQQNTNISESPNQPAQPGQQPFTDPPAPITEIHQLLQHSVQDQVPQAQIAQAQVSQAQVAQAQVAQAQVAQAQVAQAQIAQAQVSQAQVAQAQVAQALVSQAQVSQAQVAQALVSQAQVSQAQVAQALVSQAPTPQAPLPQTQASQAQSLQKQQQMRASQRQDEKPFTIQQLLEQQQRQQQQQQHHQQVQNQQHQQQHQHTGQVKGHQSIQMENTTPPQSTGISSIQEKDMQHQLQHQQGVVQEQCPPVQGQLLNQHQPMQVGDMPPAVQEQANLTFCKDPLSPRQESSTAVTSATPSLTSQTQQILEPQIPMPQQQPYQHTSSPQASNKVELLQLNVVNLQQPPQSVQLQQGSPDVQQQQQLLQNQTFICQQQQQQQAPPAQGQQPIQSSPQQSQTVASLAQLQPAQPSLVIAGQPQFQQVQSMQAVSATAQPTPFLQTTTLAPQQQQGEPMDLQSQLIALLQLNRGEEQQKSAQKPTPQEQNKQPDLTALLLQHNQQQQLLQQQQQQRQQQQLQQHQQIPQQQQLQQQLQQQPQELQKLSQQLQQENPQQQQHQTVQPKPILLQQQQEKASGFDSAILQQQLQQQQLLQQLQQQKQQEQKPLDLIGFLQQLSQQNTQGSPVRQVQPNQTIALIQQACPAGLLGNQPIILLTTNIPAASPSQAPTAPQQLNEQTTKAPVTTATTTLTAAADATETPKQPAASSSLYSLLTSPVSKNNSPPISPTTPLASSGSIEGKTWQNEAVNIPTDAGTLPSIPVDDVDRLLNTPTPQQ